MIITISSAQGQGKTTFMNDIKETSRFSSKIEVYPVKTARTILSGMGVSLDKIYADPELLIRFQQEILDRHAQIFEYQHDKKILLVERGFLDIAVFSVMNLGRINAFSNWLDAHVTKCCALDSKTTTLYLPMFIQNVANDNVRPYNMWYNSAFNCVLVDYIETIGNPFFVVKQKDRHERVKEFDSILANVL